MDLSREEILGKIQKIKEDIKNKGYGVQYGRIKALSSFEMHIGLPLTYDGPIDDLGLYVNPIGENNSKIDRILNLLDEKSTTPAKENALVVDQFVDSLTEILKQETGVLKKAKMMHCGSSYEGLIVKVKSDFDIPLILSDPFSGTHFKIERDPLTKLFQLKWKDDPPDEYKKYCDEGFLNAKQLQQDIFKRIHEIASEIHIPNWTPEWTVEAKHGLAAVGITLKRGIASIPIDLAPQIAVRTWDGCPDLHPLSSFHVELADHIRNLEMNDDPIFFFSPAVPNSAIKAAIKKAAIKGDQVIPSHFSIGYDDQQTKYGHQLLNISFSMLEKNFFQKNTNVRDMVRLVKLVLDRKDWRKKYGIKSFHLKRVAINNYQDIRKEPTKWAGFKKLMEFVKKDLIKDETIGCFMKNQRMDKLKDTDNLKKEIDNYAHTMTREELYSLV